MSPHIILICAGCLLNLIECAKILVVLPTPSYSHHVGFSPLWKELSLKGHQVTTLTTDPIKDASLVNLTEIDLSFSYNWMEPYLKEGVQSRFPISIYLFYVYFILVCDQQLQHPEVQKLIKSNDRFDLVIVEANRWPNVAFAKHFDCPLIIVSSFDIRNAVSYMLGSPVNSVVNPDGHLLEADTLKDRFFSIMYDIGMYIFMRTTLIPLSETIVSKHFGMDNANLYGIIQNVSLVVIDTDPIISKVIALPPNFIQIGGTLHRLPHEPLSKDIQSILDKSEEGFIYFSLGTNVKSTFVSKELISIFLDTFAELPYTILWKCDDNLRRKPKNVITSKWLPQEAVLGHRNIKLFIMQGGMQSLQEARHYKVPIIGIPFIGDQWRNIANVVNKGIGLSFDHQTLTKEDIKNGILEIIENPKYGKRLEELKKLSEDEPMTGLEKAVWWIEYVIRHKGATHFKSPVFDVPIYQYYHLDAIVILCTFLIIVVAMFVFVAKLINRLIKFVSYRIKLKRD
ncbi:hypothetical protein FQA39_LY15956 [Lamprigera yunnana]|nr:hypothetical protein FQA39_LY15956 [Lamprigera yunnana]